MKEKFSKLTNNFKNLCIKFSFAPTKKLLIIILDLCIVFGIIQISTGYDQILSQQEHKMEYEQEPTNINYYYEKVDFEKMSDDMAIKELIKCYQQEQDLGNVYKELEQEIKDIEKFYRKNSKHFSFIYQDLFSGFTISYNKDAPIFAASTIKAPAMIYIYENASLGQIDLDEQLTYTSNYYTGGTGVLKNKKVNTVYTVEELLQYTIYDSDNIAYKMLIDRYGRENILHFWQEKGTKEIFTQNTIWGYITASDAAIFMRELYNFYNQNELYGQKLMDHFKKAKWKIITDVNGNYNTANKGGWSGTALHDMAIVFDKNPYILAMFSNLGEQEFYYYFNNISKQIGELHKKYWQYKERKCNTIKLY